MRICVHPQHNQVFCTVKGKLDKAACGVSQSGNIIVGDMAFNWTQQARKIDYTLITPNLVDLDQYRAALGDLTEIVQGLATGLPPWFSAGSLCNDPIPALNECALNALFFGC